MERVVDKAIVFACCIACLSMQPWETALLVALLCSATCASFAEVLPRRFASLPSLFFALASLVVPACASFLPLAVYDLARSRYRTVRVCWVLPVVVVVARFSQFVGLAVTVACVIAFLLSFRTSRAQREHAAYRALRDDVRETMLALEAKNRGLCEKQDLEVRLATLAERGRIAREIHDNVGHLLTRSIMQVEALQVVHRGDDQVCSEFAQVGTTLHEAMDTVRKSVHNLHDDAFDLETQIGEVVSACSALSVEVDFRAQDLPPEVSYCFIAIVREALSNTAKHSDADHVLVSVAAYPAFYRLVVHDNGSVRPPAAVLARLNGADAGSVSVGGGIGLATMSDRARVLGGRCSVDYDHGFKVFVTVPREV